jgi:hypothetical protein
LISTYRTGKMDLEYNGTHNVLIEAGRKFSFSTSDTVKHVVVFVSKVAVRRFGVEESHETVESRSLEEHRSLKESPYFEEAYYEAPEAEDPTAEDPRAMRLTITIRSQEANTRSVLQERRLPRTMMMQWLKPA